MALTKISTGMLKQDAASSDLNIDAGTLYLDVSNNRVGIANTSPSQALDVTGNALATGWFRGAGGSASTPTFLVDGSTGMFRASGNDIGFSTAGSERMRIDSSGNVGIGTTSANNKLTVTGAGDGINLTGSGAFLRWNSGDMMIKNEGSYKMGFYTYNSSDVALNRRMVIDTDGNVGIGTTSPALQSGGTGIHINAGSYSEIKFTNSTTGTTASDGTALVSSGNDFQINNREAGKLKLRTSNTDALTVDSNSNVGIGTTSPATKLEVAGTTPVIRLTDSRLLDNPSWDNVSLGSVQFYTSDTSSPGARVGAEIEAFADGDSASAPNFNLLFKTATNTGTATEKLRIDKDGRVGIGTTSPVQALDVTGAIQTDTSFRAYDSVNTAYRNVLRYDGGNVRLETGTGSSASHLGIWTGGTERIRVTSAGNVGIGTTAPNNKLQIGTVGSSNYGGNEFVIGDGTRVFATYLNTSTDAVEFYTTRKFAFLPSGSGSTGYVGIGTASPTETLTLDGDSLTTGTVFLGPNNGSRRPFAKASNWGYSSSYRVAVLGSASNAYNTAITGSTTISFNYDPSGNSDGSFGGDGREILFRNGTQFVTPNAADDDFNLYNLVLKDGNVGIGTSSPDANLEVIGNYRQKALDGNSQGFNLTINNTTDVVDLTNYYNAAMTFGTSNTERMRIDSSGNVGIGTSSPQHEIDLTKTLTTINQNPTLQVKNSWSGEGNNTGFDNKAIGLFSAGADTVITKIQSRYDSGANVGQIGTQTAHDFLFTTGNTERMRIDSSGNVGIGTTSPTQKLEIEGDVRIKDARSLFFKRHGDNYAWRIRNESAADSSTYGFDGINSLVFEVVSNSSTNATPAAGSHNVYSSSANTLVLKETGNVGIGTDSPAVKLHVNATDAEFRLQHAGNSYFQRIFTDSSNNLKFGTGANGTERMRLASNGDWVVSNTIANVASNYGNQGGCGWVESDNHFEVATTSNRSAVELGRNNAASGDVITIRQQSASVGMIGTEGGDSLVIQSNGATGSGLRFHPNRAAIEPVRQGATIDNVVDLGADTRRFKDLYLSGSVIANGSILSTTGTAAAAAIRPNNDINCGIFFPATNTFAVTTDGSEAYRVDPFGNLLVAKTNNTLSNDGTIIRAGGELLVTNTSDIVANFNRTGTDGAISTFYKDGTTVGSIGTVGSDLYIGSGGAGLRFYESDNSIIPCSDAGVASNGAIDIGDGSFRFKDLYLSGVAYANNFVGVSDTDTGIDINGTNVMKFNTGGSERARFDSSGNLLVSKTSNDNSTAGVVLRDTGEGSFVASGQRSGLFNRQSSNGDCLEFRRQNVKVGSVSVSGTNATFNTSSDRRLKDNIVDAPSASDDIDAIQVRSFDWKADGSHQKYGMVAQELQTVAPDAVSEGDTEEDMMGVDYSKLVPMLVKEIQSLRARVAQLEQ